jgi:hypothetical protein
VKKWAKPTRRIWDVRSSRRLASDISHDKGNFGIVSDISGSHGVDSVDFCLVDCDAMQFGTSLPPSSEYNCLILFTRAMLTSSYDSVVVAHSGPGSSCPPPPPRRLSCDALPLHVLLSSLSRDSFPFNVSKERLFWVETEIYERTDSRDKEARKETYAAVGWP